MAYEVGAFDVGWALPVMEDWGFLPQLVIETIVDEETGATVRETPLAVGDVMLSRTADGTFDVAGAGAEDERVPLSRLLLAEIDPGTRVTRAGLEAIRAALAAEVEPFGFRVWIDAADIDPATGADLRRPSEAITFRYDWEGSSLPVSRFDVQHALDLTASSAPVSEILAGRTVDLVRGPDGWLAASDAAETTTILLSDLTEATSAEVYSIGAVQLILESVRDAFVDAGWLGVRVRPGGGQLAARMTPEGIPTFSDARGGETEFRFDILMAVVRDVRTVSSASDGGWSVFPSPDSGVNLPRHDRIVRRSPVRVWASTEPSDDPSAPSDRDLMVQRVGADLLADPDDPASALVRREVLDDHLYLYSRYPGRRVDAAIAPGPLQNADVVGGTGVSLDFLINETRPAFVYGQVSNTGTAQTDRVRYRFGLLHSQLTQSDDTFAAEFTTPDFSDNLAGTVSYSARVADSDRLRWRAFGSWGQFVASEVGFVGQDFEGESWSMGAELNWNFWQRREHFIDAIAGVRFFDARTEDTLFAQTGAARFLVPYAGLRYERLSDLASTEATLLFEYSDGGWTANDPGDLTRNGRLSPDEDWYKLRWDVAHAFYLEPVLDPEGWRDLSTPESSTLGHELAFRFRGQYAFDRRLVPQEEQVAGGLYSVRGYPESVSVGDTVLLGTAEYRMHLPRLLGLDPSPGKDFLDPSRTFRSQPQFVLGPTDWDLILRGFVDVGYTESSRAFGFEESDTLLGTGVGVQLLLRNNVDIRMDWGFALEELPGRVNSGSNRLHVVATFLF